MGPVLFKAAYIMQQSDDLSQIEFHLAQPRLISRLV
jgi:hypothetical protein